MSCRYLDASGTTCSEPVTAGQLYCAQHLGLLIRLNARELLIDVVVEVLGVSPDTVTDSAHFLEDLGADSLEFVALVVAVEEIFGLDIPDEKAQEMGTFGDACRFVFGRLLETGKLVLHAHRTVSKDIEHAKTKKSAPEKQIEAIVTSQLFLDYQTRLEVPAVQMRHILAETLRCGWIEHVTTVPTLHADGLLDSVSVLLLTKTDILYLMLRKRGIFAQRVLLGDVFLQPHFSFHPDGRIHTVEVFALLPPGKRIGDSDNFRFSFKEKRGIAGALMFLQKYYQYSKGVTQ